MDMQSVRERFAPLRVPEGKEGRWAQAQSMAGGGSVRWTCAGKCAPTSLEVLPNAEGQAERIVFTFTRADATQALGALGLPADARRVALRARGRSLIKVLPGVGSTTIVLELGAEAKAGGSSSGETAGTQKPEAPGDQGASRSGKPSK
jgi:hypothetical protein